VRAGGDFEQFEKTMRMASATRDRLPRLRHGPHGRARTEEVAAVLAPHLPDDSRGRLAAYFEIVVADLTADTGWNAAVAGRRFASTWRVPIPRVPSTNEADLIVPAREGVLRVLRSTTAAGVDRVVLIVRRGRPLRPGP